MEKKFNDLVNDFIENNIGVSCHFLNDELAMSLKKYVLQLYQEKEMKLGGIGAEENFSMNQKIRKDSIFWLDRKSKNEFEHAFLDLMDEFILYLNRTCYAGINSCEFHFSLFESGSFYKTHLDRFQNNNSRQFSMVSYLNDNWTEADGGQLKVYHKNAEQKINPTLGKTVFFKSNELEHEVMETKQQRLSIAGWLKK